MESSDKLISVYPSFLIMDELFINGESPYLK